MSRRERISCSGLVTLLCPFHREKTPSLVVKSTGQFFCHGCHEYGLIEDHPDLVNRVRRLRDESPEQLCFPWLIPWLKS